MSSAEASRLISFGMAVLIWMVQLVVYPGFAEVAPERFVAWHARYTRTLTWIVGPLMIAQGAVLGSLLAARAGFWVILAAAMVAIAWIATAAIAVPIHNRLGSNGLDQALVARLVATNWIRTVAWTLAFLLLLRA